MSALRETYIVRTRPAGDGYALSGPALPWPLWYLDETLAISHAAWKLAGKGGRIVVLDSAGQQIITEYVPATNTDPTQYGPQVHFPPRASSHPRE